MVVRLVGGHLGDRMIRSRVQTPLQREQSDFRVDRLRGAGLKGSGLVTQLAAFRKALASGRGSTRTSRGSRDIRLPTTSASTPRHSFRRREATGKDGTAGCLGAQSPRALRPPFAALRAGRPVHRLPEGDDGTPGEPRRAPRPRCNSDAARRGSARIPGGSGIVRRNGGCRPYLPAGARGDAGLPSRGSRSSRGESTDGRACPRP